jgi:hypothetical protein
VQYEHIKNYSTPFEETGTFPTCSYYKDAACCSADTVQQCDPLVLLVHHFECLDVCVTIHGAIEMSMC